MLDENIEVQQAHQSNQHKINLVKQLIEMFNRQPINYENINSVEDLTQALAEKDDEVKVLQKAWEQLEALLFSDLQTTLQEKNQISNILGNKRKDDKQKMKRKSHQRTQVWRSEDH
jgi:hypothetical protein